MSTARCNSVGQFAPEQTGYKPVGRYPPDADLNLPAIFWDDLTKILGLIVQTRLNVLFAQEGSYQVDRLRHSSLIQRGSWKIRSGHPWTAPRLNLLWPMLCKQWATKLGMALRSYWAIPHYGAVLLTWSRDRVPLDWAMTQNNLGVALELLGKRESGTERLLQPVAAYQAALEEYTRERVPFDWARTQDDLGVALTGLGDRESGTEHLQQAVTAFTQALEVFSSAGATHYIDETAKHLAAAQGKLNAKKAAAMPSP